MARGMEFEDLMKKKIRSVEQVVVGLVPVGLTLLASRPKLGKSWFVFDIALSVACERGFLDRKVVGGDVLYLALEDSEERIQSRGLKLIGDDKLQHSLHIETVSSRINPENAIMKMEDWAEEKKSPKLIVIDTLKKIRKPRSGTKSGYDQDYDFGAELHKFAVANRVGIVLVYHTGKARHEDFLDEVQDTTGLTATPDVVMVMRKKRGHTTAELLVTSRDSVDKGLVIEHDPDSGRWEYVSDIDESNSSNRPEVRRRVIDAMKDRKEPMSPPQIADAVGMNVAVLRSYLRRMVDYGELFNPAYGQYVLSDSVREELGLTKQNSKTHSGFVVLSGKPVKRLKKLPQAVKKPAKKLPKPRKTPTPTLPKGKALKKAQKPVQPATGSTAKKLVKAGAGEIPKDYPYAIDIKRYRKTGDKEHLHNIPRIEFPDCLKLGYLKPSDIEGVHGSAKRI